MPENHWFGYDKITRFSRARSAYMNEIFAAILSGFAKTNDYTVVTGNTTVAATATRRLLLVPSGAITITLPAAGTLTAATERDFEFLFGGMPTNNIVLPASPTATINFNGVTVEGKSVATGQIKLASAGAYLRLRYSPSAGTYLIVDQGWPVRVFGTPSSGTAIAPWVWYGDHVVVDSVVNASISAIAMPTAKLIGRSFLVTVAAAMLSGVAVGSGGDTINGAAGPRTVYPGQTVEFTREDAGWSAKALGADPEVTLSSGTYSLNDGDVQVISFNAILRDTQGAASVPVGYITVPAAANVAGSYADIEINFAAATTSVQPSQSGLLIEVSYSSDFTGDTTFRAYASMPFSAGPGVSEVWFAPVRFKQQFVAGQDLYLRVTSIDCTVVDFRVASMTVRVVGP